MFSEIKKYKGLLPINNIFFALAAICMGVLFCNQLFITPTTLSEKTSLSIFLPLSIIGLLFFVLYFYFEVRNNSLTLNNIFFILGLAVGFTNLIAVLLIPTNNILFNKTTINTSSVYKIYYIINGFLMTMLPYIFIYELPRKFLSRKNLNILLHLFIFVIYIGVFYSIIKEFNIIVEMFKTHFSNGQGLQSFFGQKNCFGRSLLAGVFACFILYVRDKRITWIIISIPLYLFIFLSMSKMTLFVAFIFTLSLLIYKLIKIIKNNKDNLMLFIEIGLFVVFLSVILIIFTSFSQCGILYSLKSFINKTFENIKATYNSRKIIWDCSFNLLKPWQYLIGYGFKGFGIAVHFVYANDPRLPPWEYLGNIWTAHNSVIDQIGNGGIIYLSLILFATIYVIYAGIKLYRFKKDLSVVLLCCIFSFLIYSFSDASYLFGDNTEFYITPIIVLVLMQEFNFAYSKKENEIRKKYIIESKKQQKITYKSKFLNLNKKLIYLEAHNIKTEK